MIGGSEWREGKVGWHSVLRKKENSVGQHARKTGREGGRWQEKQGYIHTYIHTYIQSAAGGRNRRRRRKRRSY